MSTLFSCGIESCCFKFANGSEHVDHLVRYHAFKKPSVELASYPLVQTQSETVIPAVIFQDPTQDHDVYISYCPDNCFNGKAFISKFHDPTHIAAELSKHFKPWFASVSLGPQSTGDFYDDRALHLQKVKVFVALLSSEYCTNDQCKMEYQFALLSLKKPVLPVIISSGKITSTIDSYIKKDGRVPFLMDSPMKKESEFKERMSFLVDAIKNMIASVGTDRESDRFNCLSIQDNELPSAPPSYSDVIAQQEQNLDENIRKHVPKVGDHVISHWMKHSYFTATIIKFIKEDMKFEIRWDDRDESGRFPPVTMVALDKEPDSIDIAVGSRVFFPQGSYKGEAGVRTGGMRYHEGIVKIIEPCSSNRLRCYGHHLKGASDNKWVTYSGYSYEFSCFASDLRIAPNPYDVLHVYAMTL